MNEERASGAEKAPGTELPPSAVDAGMPPEGWGAQRELGPMEALMWRMERADPKLRSTITAVDLLDAEPDWERLLAAHEWASRILPVVRKRVVEPPLGLGAPEWAIDPDFDLAYHLRRTRLPSPGSFRQVLDFAQSIAMAPFDAARPPWEAFLLEGLEGGRAAYVLKLHHSLTDGQGGIQLVTLLHSRRREPTPDKPMPAPPEPQGTSGLGALSRQALERARSGPGEVASLASRGIGAASRAIADPGASAGEALEYVRSLSRLARPPATPPSPLLRGRSLSWRFGALETTLEALKAAGKAAGGSVNDAFIAALLSGFRRYHEGLDSPVRELPIAIPISLRGGADPMGGNRFAGARLAAPVGIEDPAERIVAIHERVLAARDEPAVDVLGLLAPALNRVPMALVTRWYAGQTADIDLQASNVAGIPVPVYMAGTRITHMFPFGPLPGCAVMATLVSHTGTCCIGINLDPAAVTEPELFLESQRAGLDEVLALAGASSLDPGYGPP